jgi:hypothetical protein
MKANVKTNIEWKMLCLNVFYAVIAETVSEMTSLESINLNICYRYRMRYHWRLMMFISEIES